jgi:hypothetical protein
MDFSVRTILGREVRFIGTPQHFIGDVTGLVRMILKTRPNIGIIYMSGFTESTQKQDLAPGSVLLQKPFSLFTLATTIRQVLENHVAAKKEEIPR